MLRHAILSLVLLGSFCCAVAPSQQSGEKMPREGPLTSPADGRQLAHRMSRGYPDYSEAETDKKLRHALKEPNGPRGCRQIADAGAGAEHCARCPSRGPDLTSPILLGRRSWWRRRRRKKKNPPSIPPFPKGGSPVRGNRTADGKNRRSRVSGRSAIDPGERRQEPSSPPLEKGELEGDFSGGGMIGGPPPGNAGNGGPSNGEPGQNGISMDVFEP